MHFIDQPVSILMPVCNEASVIESVLDEWINNVFQYLPEGSEYILEDGESDDGTKDILERFAVKINMF